jgi:Holliday junction resolvase RusA-like endonuclease
VEPIGKPRQTRSDKWKRRPVVLHYRQFCDDVRGYLPDYQLPGELHLTFFIKMPASWSAKKKAAMVGAPHQGKPDVDNIAKAWMDAFKSDDSHVYSLRAEKYWADEGSIEVETTN